MIAITFALPAESAATAALLSSKQRQKSSAGRVLILGELAGRAVALVHTGVGRTACTDSIEQFLKGNTPQFLIASGVAGAVRDNLAVGDLVFAENFSERQLLLRARSVLGDRAPVRRLHTAEAIIDSAAERNEIASAHGADIVDMETAVIAEACATAGVPLLSLRVISDTPRESFPLPPAVLFDMAQQRTNFRGLSARLLRQPAKIPELLRFGQRMKKASATLAHALEDLVRELA